MFKPVNNHFQAGQLNHVPTSYPGSFLRSLCPPTRLTMFKPVNNHVQAGQLNHRQKHAVRFYVCTRYLHAHMYKYHSLLTLSHPEALHWRVKSSGIRQSKITKVVVLAGLGNKRLTSCTNDITSPSCYLSWLSQPGSNLLHWRTMNAGHTRLVGTTCNKSDIIARSNMSMSVWSHLMKHNIQIFDVASQSSIHIAMNKKCDLLDIEIHIDFNMYQ